MRRQAAKLFAANPFLAFITMTGMLTLSTGCDYRPSSANNAAKKEYDGGSVMLLTAASLRNVMEEIAARFQAEQKVSIHVNVGPSSALASQIIAGAPADIFVPASEDWARALESQHLAREVRRLVTNTLVIAVPRGNPADVRTPGDLVKATVRRVALAGENVPAGHYGEQALAYFGVYEPLAEHGRIARGHDVRVTMSYVELGEAEAGVIYVTDARLSNRVETVYSFPPSSHGPIVYSLVLLDSGQANLAARKLFDFLQSAHARRIFERHGFTWPSGAPEER